MREWFEQQMVNAEPREVRRAIAFACVVGAVACVVVTCVGCGAGIAPYRVGVEQYAEGVALMDEAIARRVESAGPEARAQVRQEIEARQILGATQSETARLALERYDELMRPLSQAAEAARYAAAGGRAMDRALDAWEAHDQREPFLIRVACALAALMALADAVVESGIELPSRATLVAETLSTWSDESCPEGGAW